MRNSRKNTLLLTAILGVAGLIGQAWLADGRVVPILVYAKADGAVRPAGAKQPTLLPDANFSRAPASATGSVTVPVMPLSADSSVLVGTMCELQLLAEGTDLTLDSDAWSTFAAIVLRTQAIRHNYEAEIATAKQIAPGQYRVEIPLYANTGDALREQFTTDLRTELGAPVALAVMTKLGEKLEGCFAGFGVSIQTLDLSADPAGQPSDIEMTRTARYWNSVAGGDRVTTRREIHYPALEDPTGESWRALLALVSRVSTGNGPG